MSDDGFVRIYRRVTENPVFRDDVEAMAFVWMVMRAAWRPVDVRYKGSFVRLDRGQLAISVRDLGERFRGTKDWANRFLARLADRDMIATASATGVNVVTICNYDKYQASSDDSATPLARQPRQHRDSTATQNKEGNEGKKEEEKEGGARATRLPANFLPVLTPDAQSIVDGWPPGMLDHELSQFRDRSAAKGTTAKDWQASFRTWLRNADKWRNERNGHRNGSSQRIGEDGFLSALREAGRGSGYPPP